jgi:hypothetical protein
MASHAPVTRTSSGSNRANSRSRPGQCCPWRFKWATEACDSLRLYRCIESSDSMRSARVAMRSTCGRYSRAAKSIVLVGGASGVQSQPHVTKRVGLLLEIVPVVNPYSEPRPTSFPVRVLYDGQVLPGALVKLINLEQDLAPMAARRSDTMGLATFPMPQTGSWLVSVVWTKRLENSSEADFETIFASLTFGLGSATSAAASDALHRRTRGCSRLAGSSGFHPETPAGGSRSSGAGAPTSIPACC